MRYFFSFFFCFFVSVSPSLSTPRQAYIVVEANSGRVLEQHNADQWCYPASLTKMMTAYLIFEALRAKKISWQTRFQVSSHAAAAAPIKLGLRKGQRLTVRDLLYTSVIRSCNDSAMVLAEGLSGSLPAFLKAMNAKARQLGMKYTYFHNPHGLPPHGRHKSTVRDLAILSRALIHHFPEYYSIFRQKTYQYGNKAIRSNLHRLMGIDGIDGIKSGLTNASGYNLAASAIQNGRRLIVVVVGGATWRQRNAKVVALFKKNFQKLKTLNSLGHFQLVGGTKETFTPSSKDSPVIRPLPCPRRTPSLSPSPVSQPEALEELIQTVVLKDRFSPNTMLSMVSSVAKTSAEKQKPEGLSSSLRPSPRPFKGKAEKIKKEEETQEPLQTDRDPVSQVHQNLTPRAEGKWGIQLGIYRTFEEARELAETIVSVVGGHATTSKLQKKNKELYRSQVRGLPEKTACQVCRVRRRQGKDCFTFQDTSTNPSFNQVSLIKKKRR